MKNLKKLNENETRNRYLNTLWKGAGFCFSTAFSNELTRILNVSFVRGKHAR